MRAEGQSVRLKVDLEDSENEEQDSEVMRAGRRKRRRTPDQELRLVEVEDSDDPDEGDGGLALLRQAQGAEDSDVPRSLDGQLPRQSHAATVNDDDEDDLAYGPSSDLRAMLGKSGSPRLRPSESDEEGTEPEDEEEADDDPLPSDSSQDEDRDDPDDLDAFIDGLIADGKKRKPPSAEADPSRKKQRVPPLIPAPAYQEGPGHRIAAGKSPPNRPEGVESNASRSETRHRCVSRVRSVPCFRSSPSCEAQIQIIQARSPSCSATNACTSPYRPRGSLREDP